MFNLQDENVEAFISYAGKVDSIIGDLGCAGGAMTRRILRASARQVIANDLFRGHRRALRSRLCPTQRRLFSPVPMFFFTTWKAKQKRV
jgi:hypothetical protein